MIRIENLSKTFILHNQGGTVLQVVAGATLQVAAGECVGLTGRSGSGKSTLMRMIHGNYLAASGSLVVAGLDIVTAQPRQIVALRRDTLGYVSQFLRVVPRVPTIEVVAEPLLRLGIRPCRPETAPPNCWRASTFPKASGGCRPRPSPAGNSSA